MVHGVSVALSWFGIGGQAFVGLLLVLALLALIGIPEPLNRFRVAISGYELWLAFGVAGGSTAGSLFFTEFANFYPGEVAWYERICMYPLSILLLLVALGADRYAVRYVIAFPIVGISVSLYALLLEDGVVTQPRSCVLSGPGGCVTKWINEFGYMTIPVMSITGFALIVAFLLFAVYSPVGGRADARVGMSHTKVTAVAIGISTLAVIAVTLVMITTSHHSTQPASVASSTPRAGNVTLGKQIFTSNACSTCHTLAAAGATSHIARPDLGTTKFSRAKIVGAITNGITTSYGAAMAPYKAALTGAQINDVATFIYQAERSHA